MTNLTDEEVNQLQIMEEITVDLIYPNDSDYARANQYNKGTWYLAVNITKEGDAWTIPDNVIAVIGGTKSDGNIIFNDILGINNNKVYLPLTEQMLAVSGKFVAQIDFYFSDKEITYDKYGFVEDTNYENFKFLSTVNFNVMVAKCAYDRYKPQSTDEYNTITKFLFDVNNLKETVITAKELSEEVIAELERIKEALKTIIEDASKGGAIIDDTAPSLSRVYSSQHCEDIFIKYKDGMGLSQNNFTDEEKIKLARIENNANYFVHPLTHPADMIVEDETHLFTTKLQQEKWDSLYSREEIDNFISAVASNMVWKSAVHTYDEILIVYPNPEEGWCVGTDSGAYRWDGKTWVKIMNNFDPIASETVDGYMSSDLYNKLATMETKAQANRIEKIKLNGTTITIDTNDKSVNLNLDSLYTKKVDGKELISTGDITKLNGIESGAQVNVIEKIYLNDSLLAVDSTNKSVKIDIASLGGLTEEQKEALKNIVVSTDISTGVKTITIGNLEMKLGGTGTDSATLNGVNLSKIINDSGTTIYTLGNVTTSTDSKGNVYNNVNGIALNRDRQTLGLETTTTTRMGNIKVVEVVNDGTLNSTVPTFGQNNKTIMDILEEVNGYWLTEAEIQTDIDSLIF